MEHILNGLKDSFQDYQEQVIKLFQEETAPWDGLFNEVSNPDICRGLFYIVKKFVEGDKTQLFIQLPTDELGQNDETQKKNRLEIQEILTDFLLLATKDSWNEYYNCANIEDANIGDFCYLNERAWEIVLSNDSAPRPKCLDEKKKLRTPEARDIYRNNQERGIRLLSNPSNIREIKKVAEKINFYRTFPGISHAKQCILVGAKPPQQNPIISCDNIHKPVNFVTNFAHLEDQTCDILVLLWDRKYLNFEIEINNLIASGQVKKVILLGTEIFDGFKENTENMCFPFTYREIFSYYYNLTRECKNRFPSIEFRKIEFPYLYKEIETLNSYIPDGFDKKERQRILGLTLRPFLGKKYEEPNTDNLREILYNEYDALSNEAIDNIVNWVNNFNCTGRTPKEENDPTNAFDPTVDIDLRSSYKRDLSKHLHASNNNRQIYLIDAPLNVYKVVDCIKALLSRGALGKYIILSYFELPKLKEFFESEVKVYKSKDRFDILNIKFELEIKKQHVMGTNLLDYYNDDFTDDILLYGNDHRQNTQNQKFECKFEGCSEDIILENGFVIYFSNTIKVEDLYNNKTDYIPCKITYYQKPEDFQELMKLYYPIPPDESVESYAKFWKVKLREMLKDRYNGDINSMHNDFKFLSLKELGRITKSSYRSMFTHKIDSIANVMARLKMITIEESICIKAAHDIVGEYSINGQRLKASLIEYQLSGKIDEFLQNLLFNASVKGVNISVDSLLSQCMITKTLIDINKKK